MDSAHDLLSQGNPDEVTAPWRMSSKFSDDLDIKYIGEREVRHGGLIVEIWE